MIRGRSFATSRWRSLVEPALVVLTVGALAAGGIAWLAGWHVVSRRLLDRRHTWSRWCPRCVGSRGVAARTGRGGSDRGAVAGRHAASGRIRRGCVDRGDAGRRSRPRGRRRAPRLPRLAGPARARAAIRPSAGRLGGERDPARPRWPWTICWSWARAKWCRWTGASSTRWPCWMNRCSPANRCRSSAAAGEPVRSGVVNAGNAFRAARHRDRAGQHVRGHRAAGRTGRSGKRADRAVGRPLRRLVPAAGAADGGRGVAGQRVSRTGSRRPGGGDSLSPACSRRRWRSSRDCHAPHVMVWSSAAAARWKTSGMQRLW